MITTQSWTSAVRAGCLISRSEFVSDQKRFTLLHRIIKRNKARRRWLDFLSALTAWLLIVGSMRHKVALLSPTSRLVS